MAFPVDSGDRHMRRSVVCVAAARSGDLASRSDHDRCRESDGIAIDELAVRGTKIGGKRVQSIRRELLADAAQFEPKLDHPRWRIGPDEIDSVRFLLNIVETGIQQHR